MQKKIIGNKWDELLAGEWQKPYYQELRSFLINEYETETIYPPAADIFNALRLTDYDDVKVVILGQDPYHEQGQAHGLAFSVPVGAPPPPSLVNIFKELKADLGIDAAPRASGSAGSPAASGSPPAGGQTCGILDPWARQGVLLLNTVLTVRAHQAGSHRGRGWEEFTDRVIELLASRYKPMVFILWGAQAQKKRELILRAEAGSAGSLAGSGTAGGAGVRRHLIIEAPHPSPLSAFRGFFGGSYFSRCNFFLADNGIEAIDWML